MAMESGTGGVCVRQKEHYFGALREDQRSRIDKGDDREVGLE